MAGVKGYFGAGGREAGKATPHVRGLESRYVHPVHPMPLYEVYSVLL